MELATQSEAAMQMSSVLRVFFVVRTDTRGDYRSAEGGVKASGGPGKRSDSSCAGPHFGARIRRNTALRTVITTQLNIEG